MTDPWLPVAPARPRTSSPPGNPYAPPSFPYRPPPARRRRTGLVVTAVLGVLLFVGVSTALAVFVGRAVESHSGASADHPVKIYGPAGDAFVIRLPTGFHDGGDSDLQGGYLGAVSADDKAPYLDVYTDTRTQSRSGDVDGVARRVQADNGDQGAKTVVDVHDVSTSGRVVAEWQDSFPGDKDVDGYTQLTAVVLVGEHGEYLEIDFSDDPSAFSADAGARAVAALVGSLGASR
ncbi:MAG: hypothetical protein ABJA34_07475 [Pseudonocardiales bacterium]